MTTDRLPAHRALALAAGASLGAAVLVAMPLAAPPIDPTRMIEWWDHTGTSGAAVAMARAVAVALAVYVALLAGLIALSSLARLPHIACTVARGLPAGLQRSVAGATIAAATLAPTIATAANPDTTPTPIVLFDIGAAEVETAPFEVPAPTEAPLVLRADALGEVVQPAEPADTWTVQRGDHLWSIAEETLADLGSSAPLSERDVARYWQRLIDENRAAIGADPDVIHPGTTLVLPQL